MGSCVDNFVMTICDFINFHLNTKNNIIFKGDRHQSKNHCQSIEGNEATKTSKKNLKYNFYFFPSNTKYIKMIPYPVQ